jgi:hypothetical protein
MNNTSLKLVIFSSPLVQLPLFFIHLPLLIIYILLLILHKQLAILLTIPKLLKYY